MLDTGYMFDLLKQIYAGFDTIKVEGFLQADTYSNCMKALDSVLRQLQDHEVEKQKELENSEGSEKQEG